MTPAVLTQKCDLPPFICFRCRTDQNREYYINTGMNTEFDGQIYLCNACMGDLVEVDKNSLLVSHFDAIMLQYQANLERATKISEDFEDKKVLLKRIGLDIEELISFLKGQNGPRTNESTSVNLDGKSDSNDLESTDVVSEQSESTGTDNTDFKGLHPFAEAFSIPKGK